MNIENMTEDELIDLNNKIIARLKFIRSYTNQSEMLKFSIGEKVSFQPPGQERKIGTLVKFNQKSVTIITDSAQKWNVSPHLISKVKPVDTANGSGTVVKINDKKKH